MEWNEWSLRPSLCTYRLNWARTFRTSWEWWDEWDDTALQTKNLKLRPWLSKAEHATSRSRRLPTILNLYEWAEKKHFVSSKREYQGGLQTRDLGLSKQAASTTASRPPSIQTTNTSPFQLKPVVQSPDGRYHRRHVNNTALMLIRHADGMMNSARDVRVIRVKVCFSAIGHPYTGHEALKAALYIKLTD